MKIELRPTIAADLVFIKEPLPFRVRCITMLQDGEVVAIGGLVFRPDGTVWISAHISPAGRAAKVSLHRAGLRVLREARAAGLRRLFAAADPGEPRAGPWMARCGLKPTGLFEEGKAVWMWESA